MTRLEPIYGAAGRHGSRLDPSMALLQRLVAPWLAIGVSVGFRFGEELFHVVPQRALIAFQREHIICLPLDNLGRDLALATATRRRRASHEDIDDHDRALDRQHAEKLRNGRDLVRLVGNFDLAEHEVLLRAPRRHHVDRRFRPTILIGPPQRLAVDGDDASIEPDQARDPDNEARLELPSLDVAKMSPS